MKNKTPKYRNYDLYHKHKAKDLSKTPQYTNAEKPQCVIVSAKHFRHRHMGINPDYLEEIAKNMLQWANNLDEYQPVRVFCALVDEDEQQFSKYARRSEYFKKYYQRVKEILEDKLTNDCLYRRADAKFAINFILPRYSDSWRNDQKEVASLHADAAEAAKKQFETGREIHIHMDKIEDTNRQDGQ